MNMTRQAILACAAVMLLATPALAQLANPGLAQDEERRGFIGFGIGPSAPLGSFAEGSSGSTSGGRATPGYTSTLLNLGYRFRDRWGVAAAFAYSEYDMRDAEDDDWWQVATLVAGPMYSHPLNSRAAVDLKAMVGLFALTPIIDSYETDDRTGSGLGLDLRVMLRYDVFRRWAVFAEGGVHASNVSFDSGAEQNVQAMISGLGIAYRPRW